MSQPASSRPSLDLPPPYTLVPLREVGDAHAHACAIAAREGAGTLVWVRRFDVAECAVVLEPEEPLRTARRAIYVGLAACVDVLASHAPPQLPVTIDWPDALRVDGVLVGGCRLGWPEACGEDEVPDWLVLSVMLRTAVVHAGDPGLRPLLGALDELGFESIDAGALVEGFARCLLAGFHDWREAGIGTVTRHFASPGTGSDSVPPLAARDDALRTALATPSWRDPATRLPWL